MQKAATRSPSLTAAPAGALRTVPATSLPGTNGRSGWIWYSPRVCSTSGNETPAAWTSITTPLPGVSGCDGSGSGRSASVSADSGPLRSVIWTARMARERISGTEAVPQMHHGVGAPRAPAVGVGVAVEGGEGAPDAHVGVQEHI